MSGTFGSFSSDGSRSDSDGNKWRLGKVYSDDDSDIDSDEAMGSGDEANFDNFAFGRDATAKSKLKKERGQMGEVDLSEQDGLEHPEIELSDLG